MKKIQEVFNKIQELKSQQKTLKSALKEGFEKSEKLQSITEKIKSLKAHKIAIESEIKSEYEKELQSLDTLKLDIESYTQILSDLTLQEYVEGTSPQVQDKYQTQYEPSFKVLFRKSKTQQLPLIPDKF